MNQRGEFNLPPRTERQISQKLLNFVAPAIDKNMILLACAGRVAVLEGAGIPVW